MKRRERREIERRLPRRYRGVSGYHRMLEEAPIRIAVTGTRGKSGLVVMLERELRERHLATYAKITGYDPISIVDGDRYDIVRAARPGALLHETMWELKRWWGGGYDALVLENQATSEYTMRVFNQRFARPKHLLIPNVRRDHLAELGRSLEVHARAFVRAAPRGTTIVSAEPDPRLKAILADATGRIDGRFIDVAPDPEELPPGFGRPLLVDATLRDIGLEGLGPARLEVERQRLNDTYVWRPSAHEGLDWFDGAGINDVDSTAAVLRWLQERDPRPVALFAYFREDRPDRTATFRDLFHEVLADGSVERVYLSGARAQVVARRLRAFGDRVRVVPEDLTQVDRVVGTIAEECQGGAVMTVANAVPPFPRAVSAALRNPDPANLRGEYAILTAVPDDLPERVAARYRRNLAETAPAAAGGPPSRPVLVRTPVVHRPVVPAASRPQPAAPPAAHRLEWPTARGLRIVVSDVGTAGDPGRVVSFNPLSEQPRRPAWAELVGDVLRATG